MHLARHIHRRPYGAGLRVGLGIVRCGPYARSGRRYRGQQASGPHPANGVTRDGTPRRFRSASGLALPSARAAAFSSDISSSAGLSAASATHEQRHGCLLRARPPRSASGGSRSCARAVRPPIWVSSAISRRATTGFLSLSRSTVSLGACRNFTRAMGDASITRSNRFGTLSTQSSTVTRAISVHSNATGM